MRFTIYTAHAFLTVTSCFGKLRNFLFWEARDAMWLEVIWARTALTPTPALKPRISLWDSGRTRHTGRFSFKY